jgi:coenzyme F420-reducing hydrogenase beta subunit
METVIEKQLCTGCHACFNACPVRAIRMEEDGEGFLFPRIKPQLCVDCGKCRVVCPVLHRPACNPGEDTYVCAAAETEERLASSSGGIFGLLAEETLRGGGLVCGAAYDGPGRVRHIVIEDLPALRQIRGTKYVQSEIGDGYHKVGEALKEGRQVLFSGTGCQVAGLKSYLGCDPGNLLTVDLICHGVPSPAVWRDYLLEAGEGAAVVEAEFRARDLSGEKTGFRILLENGEERGYAQKDDLYVKGFLQNLYLRRSCFSCAFKGSKRCSDLTIGDFWSAKEFHPALDDGLGVSAVLLHSEKGREAFHTIRSRLKWEQASPAEAAIWNECLMESVKDGGKREAFYSRWRKETLIPLLRDLTEVEVQAASEKTGFIKKSLRKLKRLLG